MKKTILTLLAGFVIISTYAQVTGKYIRDSDNIEYEVVVGAQTLRIDGYMYNLTFHKQSDGVFEAEGGSILKAGEDQSFTVTYKTNPPQRYSLFVPEVYSLPDGIKEHVVNGKMYFYKPELTEPHLVGEYLYEGEGEPKALLKSDGTGYFKHPVDGGIEYWGVETNYKGEIRKFIGATGNYSVNIAVKHTDGTHRRMQIIVFPDEQKSVLYSGWIFYW